MPYRFVDKTRTMIVHEETGQVLEWNPATDKIVSDHGFAGEACRAAGRRSRCRQSSRPGVLMTPIAAGAGN